MRKIFVFLFLSFFIKPLFSQQLYVSTIAVMQGANQYCTQSTGGDRSLVSDPVGARIEFDQPIAGYPGGCVSLCVWISAVIQTTADTNLGVDDLTFEIFKFRPGANPLDPSSTPPIRTITLYPNVSIPMNQTAKWSYGPVCTAWDGSYNVEGFWGKTNGQFGFRATVRTNMVSPQAGNINIQHTGAFPGQNQNPITVDVVNIHVVKATPTVIGKITGVGTQPYNILYRLSKDANVTIRIYGPDNTTTLVRTLVNNQPRYGEGIPDGTLMNGDFWDGRDDNGLLVQPGNYYYRINAYATDTSGTDNAKEYTGNISMDPLQITDIAVKDLGPLTTDVAIISYMLSEDATVYLDIYPPGTQFNSGVNCSNRSIYCQPRLNGNPVSPLKSIMETKQRRQTVSMYWDGKDNNGNYLCDDQYVFALSAVTRGRGGGVWTRKLGVGHVSIAKGNPLAFLSPSSTVVGSTPPAAGINPFYFRYRLQRPATVNLEIRDMNNQLIRTIVNNESRSSGLESLEIWDGRNNLGNWVSSGTYRVAMRITDPHVCMSNNIFTHGADIGVNLFRIVDVVPQHIIGLSTQGAVAYTLSQSMWTELKIYRSTVPIDLSAWPWNSGIYSNDGNIVYSISGMRPGKFKVTEFWNGRDKDGYIVEDGRYPFTLVACTTETPKMCATDKIYGYIDISRGPIIINDFAVTPTIADMKYSSDVIKLPPYMIEYSLTRHSSVTVTITDFDSGAIIAYPAKGESREPFILYKDFWDGKCEFPISGKCKKGEWFRGSFNVNIYAQDLYLNPSAPVNISTVITTMDSYPLRIYDLAIAPLTPDGPAQISYQLSESMKVAIKIYKPETEFLGSDPQNCGPNEEKCLIRAIVNSRPGRTVITEYWDGKDKFGQSVPDGNYIVKIFASPKSSLIDANGNCTSSCNVGKELADDIYITELPVLQPTLAVDVGTKVTKEICSYIEANSIFFPNPLTRSEGYFKFSLPQISSVKYIKLAVDLYNLAGDKVYSYTHPSDGSTITLDSSQKCYCGRGNDNSICNFCEIVNGLKWTQTNNDNKKVAPGLYIAVFKVLDPQGSIICQFRKKILVP